MARFIFFTKTLWIEPPRLRHQLARLLASNGHQVVFFEKPTFFLKKSRTGKRTENHIEILKHKELIHHRLRIGLLNYLNKNWTKKSIEKKLRIINVKDSDIIVNFNYEYYFLRDIFSNNKMITIINDDFISGGLLGYSKPFLKYLRLTCKSSDHVLTVSTSLIEQLSDFCSPQLFLPWTDVSYQKPIENKKRNILLYWGYINSKIDFRFVAFLKSFLQKMDPPVKLLFVGPVDNRDSYLIKQFASLDIELLPSSDINNLPLGQVFASIIPYLSNVPAVDAIMLPNKTLQLLAKGIPMIITGMPNFIKAPFIFRVDENTVIDVIRKVQNQFDQLQPEISNFVSLNLANSRLNQFMSLV